jgi:hypothetical protein
MSSSYFASSSSSSLESDVFDVDSYSIQDLCELFHLPEGQFTVEEVLKQRDVFQIKMRNSGWTDSELEGNLRFLEGATKKLVLSLSVTNHEQRAPTAYTLTSESEFHVGKMNPLATRIITRCLTVDTRFRDNYFATSSSDLYIHLPQKLSRVVSMQLSAMELPMTFYGIMDSYGNNYIYMTVSYQLLSDTSPKDDFMVLVIPDGNYNAADLISTLNNLLAPTEADGVTLLYPNAPFSYIQFALDVTATGSGTAKVYVQTTGTETSVMNIFHFAMDFSADLNGESQNIDISTRLGWNLGFRKRSYTGSTYYLSETTIEPTTIRYVYLAIDDFNHNVNQHFMTAYNNSQLNANILARITLKGTYFTMIMENDFGVVTEPRKYFGPVDITKMHILLLDDRGRVVPMNSADYVFTLTFRMLYDP